MPDAARDFAYTTTGTGGGTFGSGFSLDDDADATLPNTLTFTFTGADATGTKTITETLPVTGWTLTNLVCSKGTTTLATGLASIALLPGDAVTCTYTNARQPIELIVEKVVVNDDGGTAVVDDFGITTSAGSARLRRRGRGPDRHLHLHRRDPRGRARHVHPRRARGGRLRADRLDLQQRRRRHLRRGQRDRRGRRRAGHLLDHQRRPAGRAWSSARSSSTTTAAPRSSTTSASPPAPARSSSAPPVEAPTDTFTYTAATLEVAPGTYTLAELAVAGYAPTAWTCSNGDGGTFDAGSVTVDAGDAPVTCSITNDDIACPLPLAGNQDAAVSVAAAPAPPCSGVGPGTGVGPESDIASGTVGSSPSGDPRDPWLEVQFAAVVAILAVAATIWRRRRSPDVA